MVTRQRAAWAARVGEEAWREAIEPREAWSIGQPCIGARPARIERQQDISAPYTCSWEGPAADNSTRAQGAVFGDAPAQRICASALPGVGTQEDAAKSSASRNVMD